MKLMHTLILSLTLGMAANAALAYSPASAHALPENSGCHLMTAQECNAHLAKLGSLPVGEEREAYLAAHQALIRERSALCSSSARGSVSVIRASYR
jgi:hypothetical protein